MLVYFFNFLGLDFDNSGEISLEELKEAVDFVAASPSKRSLIQEQSVAAVARDSTYSTYSTPNLSAISSPLSPNRRSNSFCTKTSELSANFETSSSVGDDSYLDSVPGTPGNYETII